MFRQKRSSNGQNSSLSMLLRSLVGFRRTTRRTLSVVRRSEPQLALVPTIALRVERDHERTLCRKSVLLSRKLTNRASGSNWSLKAICHQAKSSTNYSKKRINSAQSLLRLALQPPKRSATSASRVQPETKIFNKSSIFNLQSSIFNLQSPRFPPRAIESGLGFVPS